MSHKPKHPLLPEQVDILQKRFPWFDPEACAPYFHPDQPDEGKVVVGDQGAFPAILLRNNVTWFPDPERRPTNADGHPLKSKVPFGAGRPILYDTLDAPELLLVEGEMHALAARSIGQLGVLVAGGVATILAKDAATQAGVRRIVEGRAVRVLFDADEAGQGAVRRVARRLLECGAARVAVVAPPYGADEDLDTWLAQFADPVVALGRLFDPLSKAEWQTLQQAQAAGEARLVQSERVWIEGQDRPVLVVMTYEEATRRTGLAIFGPEDLVAEPEPPVWRGPSVTHDAPEPAPPQSKHWTWHLVDSWAHNGALYQPDPSADRDLRRRTLVLPPPPWDGPDTSEGLWRDIAAHFDRWVVLPDAKIKSALVAYVFLTWRLHDAEFEYMPILRVTGPSGSGKGRLLKILRSLCWRSFSVRTTADNVHWLVRQHGDVTQIFDEFHLDRGRSADARERLIDTLNFGCEIEGCVGRVVKDRQGSRLESFPVFGARVLAGYSAEEHEALARRTLLVRMRRIESAELPSEMRVPGLPDQFHGDAERLRARLLAWRARKLALGKPQPDARFERLCYEASLQVAEPLWPLVAMVPGGLKGDLDNLIECALERAKAFKRIERSGLESYLVGAMMKLIEEGKAPQTRCGDAWVVPTTMLVEALKLPSSYINEVPKLLGEGGLGFPHDRYRIADPQGFSVGARPGGFKLAPTDPAVREIMESYGHEWPPEMEAEKAAL